MQRRHHTNMAEKENDTRTKVEVKTSFENHQHRKRAGKKNRERISVLNEREGRGEANRCLRSH